MEARKWSERVDIVARKTRQEGEIEIGAMEWKSELKVEM